MWQMNPEDCVIYYCIQMTECGFRARMKVRSQEFYQGKKINSVGAGTWNVYKEITKQFPAMPKWPKLHMKNGFKSQSWKV